MLLQLLLLAQSLNSTPIETKVLNPPNSPVHVDTCVAHVNSQDTSLYVTTATLHNVSKKRIKVIGFTLIPRTAFDDAAGDPRESLLNVDLSPGEEMGEDYPFTDGAKNTMLGFGWHNVYQINCVVWQVRFADDTVWKL